MLRLLRLLRFTLEPAKGLLSKLLSSLQRDSFSESFLLGVLSIWCILILSLFHSFRTPRKEQARNAAALEALLTLINPTQSFWPADIVHASATTKDKTINLSLHQIYSHIISGSLELRNPSIDLVHLLRDGEYRADGWSIRLAVESWLWSAALFWIFRSFVWVLKPRNLLELGRRRKSYTFDSIPLSQIETFTRDLQSQVSPGSCVTLEFTTWDVCSSSTLDLKFFLCCIPFLLRKRTPTPLFLSLDRVIRLLSSGGEHLCVEIVQNYSERYAMLLDQSVSDMEQDAQVRTEVIEGCGMDGWRAERFHCSLEAALIRARILARWRVSARKL